METDDKKKERVDAIDAELRCLMSSLSANSSSIGDWKIARISEERLLGNPDPYDLEELAAKRNEARLKIRALQKEREEIIGK